MIDLGMLKARRHTLNTTLVIRFMLAKVVHDSRADGFCQ